MGQYSIFLHDAVDGHGINNQRIYHRQDNCIEKNGKCADTLPGVGGVPPGPMERSKVTSNGIAIFTLNNNQENHYFYWNPAAWATSGGNTAHYGHDPANNFRAEIVY